jgi:hypothetical protein
MVKLPPYIVCPVCKEKVEIGRDEDCFTCYLCGTKSIVRRRHRYVSLDEIAEVKAIWEGTDRVAVEQAIIKLEKQISNLKASQARIRNDPEKYDRLERMIREKEISLKCHRWYLE